VVLFQALKNLDKARVEVARSKRLEEIAALIVTGNLGRTAQGVGVIWPLVRCSARVGTPKTTAMG
jgi:hypothetical protein